MPCDTITTTSVALENVKDLDVLRRAAAAEFGSCEAAGVDHLRFTAYGYTVDIRRGRASSVMSPGRLGEVVGRVKQAYAREVVTAQARRFGWTVVKGADANHFQIRKG